MELSTKETDCFQTKVASLNFFEDEGLDVKFVIIGSDDGVAEKVRERHLHFGVCDPVCCFHSEREKLQGLRILMPVVKKLDLTVLGRLDLIKSAKPSTCKIVTYKRPSTTFSAAMQLKKDLQMLETIGEVEIEERDSSDKCFTDRIELGKTLETTDVILLWNPASTWVTGGHVPNFEKFGRLVCSRNTSIVSNPKHWDVLSNDDELLSDDYYPWHPRNAAIDGHKMLASGLITSNYLVKHRPELCRRVFRAISRALVRIEGADWSREMDRRNKKSLEALLSESVGGGEYIQEGILRELVHNINTPEYPSIFPFIQGIHDYDPKDYCRHLKNLRILWNNCEETSVDLEPFEDSDKDYMKYFITRQNLNVNGDA